jgi:hypothetical protein
MEDDVVDFSEGALGFEEIFLSGKEFIRMQSDAVPHLSRV